MNWTRIYPSWLVGEYKGEIVGVVQALVGYPMGHIGFLAVVPKYQFLGFGVRLHRAAENVFALHGCDAYDAMTDNPHILRKLDKIRAVTLGSPVSVVLKRVPKVKIIGENDEGLSKTGT